MDRYLNFESCSFFLESVDQQIFQDFGRVFTAFDGSPSGSKVDDLNTGPVSDELARKLMYGRIMQQMSDSLCREGIKRGSVMHASGVELGHRAICFMGASGSGKTSMAIDMSRFGSYLGDECAYLDIDSGEIWYEAFPLQIKAENTTLLARFNKDEMIAASMPNGREAVYCSLRKFALPDRRGRSSRSLGAVIFPLYDCACSSVLVRPSDFRSLPYRILGSLAGDALPSILLQRFFRMCSRKQIMILDLIYGNGSEAALALNSYLSEVGFYGRAAN